MADINLLPWRQERRKRLQRNVAMMTGCALLITVLVMLLVRLEIGQRIDYQQRRNQFLTNQMAQLDRKIQEIQELDRKKKNLVARMEIIQRLQISRPEAVHLFDELGRTTPEGVQLLELQQTERTIAITGIAQSNARVSVYMRNLDLSPWFQEPALQIIETKPEGKEKKERHFSRFALQVKQADPPMEVDPGKPAAGKPGA
jgi:type IV pilus assembly protein PilN